MASPLESPPALRESPIADPPPRTPFGIFDPVPESRRGSSRPLVGGGGDGASDGASDGEFFQASSERRWTVYGDAIFLQRSRPKDMELASSVADPTDVVLNANDFRFGMEPGFRVGAIHHDASGLGFDFEALYFGVDGWESSLDRARSPNDWISASYGSKLHNVEVNARWRILDRLSLLAGVRYLELNESLTMRFADTPTPEWGMVAVGANNHLIGVQLGADGRIWTWNRLELDCVLKAGIYNNDADNSMAFSWSDVPLSLTIKDSDNDTAFVGEVGVTGLFHLAHGWVIRGGYQLLWIDGVALASDQCSDDPAVPLGKLDVSSSPFYHGAFAGLEFRR